MGTFHDDLGDLHGITVVVTTSGSRTYIGRCHEENAVHVVLHDVDTHDTSESDVPPEEFVTRAAKFGHWAKQGTLVVPRGEVTSITRLGEIARR